MPNISNKTTTCARALQLRETRSFFLNHGEAMLNASLLLGGAPAQRRCLGLQSHIAEAHDLTVHAKRDLVRLHDLLMLERVGDPDSIETELFQAIHPEDPVVEDLCLLADRMQDLLVSIVKLSDTDRASADTILDQDAA